MTFGKRLKSLRNEKELTLEQLAKRFNMSKTAFSNYENNYRKPDMDLMSDLADFFDVSVDYLLCRTNEPELINKSTYKAVSPKTDAEKLGYIILQNLFNIGEITEDEMKSGTLPEEKIERLHKLFQATFTIYKNLYVDD